MGRYQLKLNNNSVSIDEIKRKIHHICASDSRILAAYIFGSGVSGNKKTSNDIDIAILLKDESLNDFSILSFISLMEKTISYPVDIIILNRASEFLKYEIRKNSYLIFERDRELRINFEVKGRKNYQDFLYLHNIYVKNFLMKS